MRPLAASLRRVGQLAGAVSLLAAATGSQARAQSVQGFADNRFEPAGAGSEWRTLESLRFDGHLRPALALVQNWAWKPLVAYDPQGSETGALIRQQLISHLDAAVMLWDRARFDLSLPLALGQTGSATDIDGLTYAAPQGHRRRRPPGRRRRARVSAGGGGDPGRGRAAAVPADRADAGVQQRRRLPRVAARAGGGRARPARVGGAPRRPHPTHGRLPLQSGAGQRIHGRAGGRLAGHAARARRSRDLRQHDAVGRPVRVARRHAHRDVDRRPGAGGAGLERGVRRRARPDGRRRIAVGQDAGRRSVHVCDRVGRAAGTDGARRRASRRGAASRPRSSRPRPCRSPRRPIRPPSRRRRR